MGMRIGTSSPPSAPVTQSSTAQWQQAQLQQLTQSASVTPSAPQPSKPTATLGNNLNTFA